MRTFQMRFFTIRPGLIAGLALLLMLAGCDFQMGSQGFDHNEISSWSTNVKADFIASRDSLSAFQKELEQNGFKQKDSESSKSQLSDGSTSVIEISEWAGVDEVLGEIRYRFETHEVAEPNQNIVQVTIRANMTVEETDKMKQYDHLRLDLCRKANPTRPDRCK